MAAGANDKFSRVISGTTRPVATTLSAQKVSGATTASVVATTGWDNTTAVHGIMYRTDSSNNKVPGSQIDWKGTFSGTTISNFQVTAGSDDTYAVGTTVELSPTAAWADDLVGGILVEHDQDGTHGDVTANSIVATTGTFTNLTINGTSGADGWSPLGQPLTSITALGNRSYTAVVSGVDTTGVTSVGQRLKLPRTVTAPTGALTLNGTTQYASKTTPSGMAQTDDISVVQWVKISAYQQGYFQSKTTTPGTNGWRLYMDANGTVSINGDGRYATTYQSLPLNKWVHIAATLDMSGNSALIYFDGVLVPSSTLTGVAATFTNSGNYAIGATSAGATPLAGKIVQVAVFSAVLSAATIKAMANQTLTGSETNVISAYKLDQASGLNDLSANANNLTATGSPTYASDTPFTNSVTGTSVTAGTTNYGIIMAQSFSTNTTYTIQIPEGETLPTTGGIGTVSYSTMRVPYGFPGQEDKWTLGVFNLADNNSTTNSTFNHNITLNIPIGVWKLEAEYDVGMTNGSTAPTGRIGASDSPSAYTNRKLIGRLSQSTVNSTVSSSIFLSDTIVATTMTPYYTVSVSGNAGTAQLIQNATYGTMSFITIKNSYL